MVRDALTAILLFSAVASAAEPAFKDNSAEQAWLALPEKVRVIVGAHLIGDPAVQKVKTEQKKNEPAPRYEVEVKNIWGKYKVKLDGEGRLAFDTYSRPYDSLPDAVIKAAHNFDPDVRWSKVAKAKKDKDRAPVYKLTADINGDTLHLEVVENGTVKSSWLERQPRVGVGFGFGFGFGSHCEPGYSPFID